MVNNSLMALNQGICIFIACLTITAPSSLSLQDIPECVAARHQVVEGEHRGVGGDLLVAQGNFDRFPVPRHHLVIVRALWGEEAGRIRMNGNVLWRPVLYEACTVQCVWHSRLPSMTVELVGREISRNFGETTATGGLFTRGSVRWKTRH